MRASFGDCTFDGETRELFRLGQPIHLSPKAFRLLELLLESRPRALSKAVIHEKIWPDAFVSEATLASLVAEIREAIADFHAIRTVHGFGYAFGAEAADVSRPAAGALPAWRLIWEDRVLPLSEGETILGRDPAAGIRIPSEGVSRRHARILIAGDSATLEDLGSKNGTFLGEKKITGPVRIGHDDSFRLGSAKMTLRAVADDRSTQTEIGMSPGNEAPPPKKPPAPPVRRKTPRPQGRG